MWCRSQNWWMHSTTSSASSALPYMGMSHFLLIFSAARCALSLVSSSSVTWCAFCSSSPPPWSDNLQRPSCTAQRRAVDTSYPRFASPNSRQSPQPVVHPRRNPLQLILSACSHPIIFSPIEASLFSRQTHLRHTCPVKIFSGLIQPISSREECEIHHFRSRDARELSKS